MMKQKKHRKIPALAAGTTLVAAMTLMASCSTDYEDKIVYRVCQAHPESVRPFNRNRRQGRLHLPDQQPDQREEIGSGRFARHHQLECETSLQRHPRDVYSGG